MKNVLNNFRILFKTIKSERHLIISGLLLVVIPAATIFNTWFIVRGVKSDVNIELARLGDQIANIIERSIRDDLSNPGAIDAIIGDIVRENDEIESVDVLVPIIENSNINFKIISSIDSADKGKISDSRYNLPVWNEDRSIRYSSTSTALSIENQANKDPKKQFLIVVRPMHDVFGAKLGLIRLKISFQIIHERMAGGTFLWSYVILAGTLVIVLTLVAFNSRLFQYALLARRLKEVDQMKDEFISMASHELRAPITAVRGYLSMILDGSVGPVSEGAKKILDTVSMSSKRLADLVEDLLEVSRIEQGRMKLTLAPVDVQEVISASITELAISAKEKGLELNEQKWDGEPPKILADNDRMRQIVVNLLSNAIKYTLSGSVAITTLVKDGFVEIRIRDTGIGMGAQEREHLFEKFYRVKNDKTAKIIGTGLGLWITKQLIEIQKGSIRVDSIENVGTEIILQFPTYKDKKK